jgi:aminopeptidase N
VKYPDHPIYANTYSIIQDGSNWVVGFRVNQTQTTTPFHQMPIVVKVQFSSGPDTSIRVMNDANLQLWNWVFDRTPIGVVFDPDNDIVLKQASLVMGIDPVNKLPFFFSLHQNFPNPFNPVTTIKYDIPKRTNVTLKIYNATGQLVSEPVKEFKEAGEYAVQLNLSNYASGVYFYKLEAGTFNDTKKMVVVK